MSTIYEIPLLPGTPQIFPIALANITYNLRFDYEDVSASFTTVSGQFYLADGFSVAQYSQSLPKSDAGWIMDVSDDLGNPIVCGIPLITGADLLAQYAYLGIGGKMFVLMNGGIATVPGFNDLGVEGRLYFETL